MPAGNGIRRLIDDWLQAAPKRSLRGLGRASGLTPGYLSRLHRGEREGFRPATVGPLAQGLGVPVEVVIKAAGIHAPLNPMTFREFIANDSRLSERQKRDLLHTYYETFGIRDGSE